jgi:hypothetical protein
MHSGKRLGCQNPGTRGDINMQQMVIGGDTTENFHFILVVDKVDFFCIYFNHVISLSLSRSSSSLYTLYMYKDGL